ncbi:MFS transporter [Actinomadura luteofluorescens]|uniref:MFS transporter n=1 Tax=Actinomadura luteofluorescens TaxID=46163 RepID=UPI00362DACA6
MWHEARTASPAFDVRLFKDARMSAAVASIALCFFAATGVFFFANFYMQSVRGLTPLQSGAMVLPFAVAQLAFAPRSAAMVRRFGAKAVCTVGLLLVTVALASYQFVGVHTSLWILGAIFFVQGVGMANVMPPATESVMSALPREKAAPDRPSTTPPARSRSRWAWPCSAPSSPPSTAATCATSSPRCPRARGRPPPSRSRARTPSPPRWDPPGRASSAPPTPPSCTPCTPRPSPPP